MFASSKLGRFFGIDFYLHGTFWLLPLFVLFEGVASGGLGDAVFDVAVLLAVFACVGLHEVGHALAGRAFGFATRDITLYPIGGVARLEGLPRNPWQEIAIALAGPAVNVVIAGGLLLGALGAELAVPTAWSAGGHDLGETFLVRLFYANVVLVVFNLIPAFPMDGGRVLRAALSIPLGRLRATEIASTVGGVVAGVFFLTGLGLIRLPFLSASPMLMVLAVAVYLLGKAELAAVRHQERGRGWRERVADHFGRGDYTGSNAAPFSGWKFDPARKVWTEWRHGSPVREVPEV